MSLMGECLTKHLQSITLAGELRAAATAGTTNSIKVLIYDAAKNVLIATGTEVPTDTTAGYAKGCLFIKTDVAAATSGLYVNVGTTTSCDFNLVTNA